MLGGVLLESDGVATEIDSRGLVEVAQRSWRLVGTDGKVLSSFVRFMPDGFLTGATQLELTGWSLIHNRVLLHAGPDDASARLLRVDDSVLKIQGGRCDGCVLEDLDFDWTARPQHARLTSTLMAEEIAKYGWKVGDHSYGRFRVLEARRGAVEVGKFCSIASGVVLVLRDHRTDSVTTYPFRALRSFWPGGGPAAPEDHVTHGNIVIGNDVWIGARAMIMSGVTVGDGVVIGANSVVTRDLPPYSMAAGSPARMFRFRFSPDRIESLLRIRWWDWPDEAVDRHIPLMLGDNVDEFLQRCDPVYRLESARRHPTSTRHDER
jgi:acetyltransferase-like isoleucine patch superfamily enzyme